MTESKEIPSPYYPPRARWTSPARQRFFAVRRALRLEKLPRPVDISWRDFFLGLLVPGHAFSAFGRPIIGRAILIAFGVELLVFLAALGYAPANIAFGLMISSHATSIIYLAGRLSGVTRLRARLCLAVIVLLVVSQLVYLPLRRILETRFVPVRIGSRVLVIQRMPAPETIQRGDAVAYRFSARSGDHVRIEDGLGFGPVQAVGGDQVRFYPDRIEINGEARPRDATMPASGELVIPDKHWFIWPRLVPGREVGGNVSGLLLETAIVPETQYLGRPFRHWFGRRQDPSPLP